MSLHFVILYVLVMFMLLNLPVSVMDRFTTTLDGLCRAVAARSLRGMLTGPLILLIWCRVRRISVALQALALRVEAGRGTRRFLGRRASGRRASGRPASAQLAEVVVGGAGGQAGGGRGLPRRLGWLLGLVPYEAACFAGQLQTVLGDPEMVALLTVSPQARRILAPLCQMLGLERGLLTPGVTAPVVDRVPVVGPVAGGRVRAARVPIDFGRIPLPRGVLVAARRQEFGKRVC